MEVNASDRAMGVILLQDSKPIAFESEKNNKAQQNYSIYER